MTVLHADIKLQHPGFTLDLSCDIDHPITGIFGPSGAGKTTILQVLAGLQQPSQGHIRLLNKVIYDNKININLPPEKRNIGYVFQDSLLFPHLNVAQNLKFGIHGHVHIQDFKEVVDLLGIENLLSQPVTDISGGQARRVAIGRALLSAPGLLMLDEPFSALEKSLRHRIIDAIKPYLQKHQIPMLVVSHDLADLLMLTDELMIIEQGRCTGHGNYYELIGSKTAMHSLSQAGMINSIAARLNYVNEKKGLVYLSHGDTQIFVESWLDGSYFMDKNLIHASLRPEDITLAKHQIQDISIQNQLPGTIEKLIMTGNKVLCIIDHGFKLIAEVTIATQQKMKLEEGDQIWSLFKAAAVKIEDANLQKNNLT